MAVLGKAYFEMIMAWVYATVQQVCGASMAAH